MISNFFRFLLGQKKRPYTPMELTSLRIWTTDILVEMAFTLQSKVRLEIVDKNVLADSKRPKK